MVNDFLLLSVVFSFQGTLLLIALVLTLYITCSFFGDVRVSNLEKKAVFITGCDSGFGYELAKKLDAERLRVFAACLTSEGEAKLKNECSPELITLKKWTLPSQGIFNTLYKPSNHTCLLKVFHRSNWIESCSFLQGLAKLTSLMKFG